jgi:hypothetical protein
MQNDNTLTLGRWNTHYTSSAVVSPSLFCAVMTVKPCFIKKKSDFAAYILQFFLNISGATSELFHFP